MSNALRSPITWYGGKGHLAREIVRLLPAHEVYVESFFGGGSVFFAKPPAAIEVINDIHSGVVTLYRVLRDPAAFEQFYRMAELTPYAREEWNDCNHAWALEEDPVRKAWMFFVTARQTFSGHVSGGSWRYSVASTDSVAAKHYRNAVVGLPKVHDRLKWAQVEQLDWRDLLPRYDSPNALHYVDPPYVVESRRGGARYEFEMSLDDHQALTETLLSMQAMVVLSGFRFDAVHGRLEAEGWQRIDFDVALNAARARVGERRTESVWLNPAAAGSGARQTRLSLEEETA